MGGNEEVVAMAKRKRHDKAINLELLIRQLIIVILPICSILFEFRRHFFVGFLDIFMFVDFERWMQDGAHKAGQVQKVLQLARKTNGKICANTSLSQ